MACTVSHSVKGYLHLRGLFTASELAELSKAAAAAGADGAALLLVEHLGLNRYLDLLMGEGNSRQPESGEPCKMLDGGVSALPVPLSIAEEAPLVGGSELRNPSRGYVAREGHRFAQGIRVVVALSDTTVSDAPSPFVVVPCSHKLNVEA